MITGLLPILNGCSESRPPASDIMTNGRESVEITELGKSTEVITEKPMENPLRDLYEDLSFQVPVYTDPGYEICHSKIQGEGRIRANTSGFFHAQQ